MRLSGARRASWCRVAAVVMIGICGCAGRGSPSSDAPRRSCAATARPYEVALSRPGPAVTIGERTFNYAWRRTAGAVEVVIVSLGVRGEFVVTPVPVAYADSVAIAGDAGGLWIFAAPYKGHGSLLRVALLADGSLRADSAVALPEVAWGWPAELTSDGARARLVHRLATAEQTIGATVAYTIDLATRRVIATAPAAERETRVVERRERLPDSGYARTIRAEHPDGVIEVGWTGWHGLAHDVEHDPPGMREYFEHWSFKGGAVRLLRRGRGGWSVVEAVTLPLADAHGTFHEGYEPTVLRSGAHAAVLLAPMGGSEPAWVVPFLRGCADAIVAGAI